MARALVLADRATTTARPNPGVGCVLIRDGRVLSEGVTQPVGGPHAEVMALAAAGGDTRGATAVTTLEPCSHHGRTPPCTSALLEAGIARVVYALADPNPPASGGGAVLRAAGVDVEVGHLAAIAQEVHRHFLVSAAAGRPAVTLKVAMTVDGAMALHGRRWVTGPEARRRVHAMRAAADAVLVGVGTIHRDDPLLDARDVAATGPPPRAVVLDRRLTTPPTARVVRAGTVIVTSVDADAASERALASAGALVLRVPFASGDAGSPAAALAALAELGMTHVLAEPGPRLGGALLAANLVDDVLLHVAPDVADGRDLPTVAAELAHPLQLDIHRLRMLGDDLEIHLRAVTER